jgi:Cu(I)/Ag(I) efflux system membrane fusion protein/cobalt-zinc-cadmium efflux system membrane fusion protein
MTYRKPFIVAVVLNVAFALAAYWFWHARDVQTTESAATGHSAEHPPMEGFTPTPVEGAPLNLAPIELPLERMQSIGVRTGKVEYKTINSEIRATGTIDLDERRTAYVQSRYPGWIKDVFVNASYEFVKKGQPLFTIYSPELVASEQEYLLAKSNAGHLGQSSVEGVASGADTLLHSSRERLLQWNLSEQDIAKLEASGQPQKDFTFASPVSGYVIERMALPNVYAQPEMRLYSIADLSSVWVNAQVFQEDTGKLKPGDSADVTVDAYPSRIFHAHIEQILPQVDAVTRTLRVRLAMSNPDLALKPGMFVNVHLRAPLGRQLIIPASAVLQAGSRQVVFLFRGQGSFEPREVQLGMRTDDGFVVLKGLKPGDSVATSANFLIDSESQLQAASGAYTPPPPGAGAAEAMNGSAQQVSAELTTDPSPPQKGKNRVQVKLTGADSKPLAGAAVSVRFFMPGMADMGMAPMTVTSKLTDQGNGVYAGEVDLGSGGTWQVRATAEQAGTTVLTKHLSLTATGGR